MKIDTRDSLGLVADALLICLAVLGLATGAYLLAAAAGLCILVIA